MWTLLLIGTFALAATGPQAQSIEQAGLVQERVRRYTKVRLEVTMGDDRDDASARARLDFLDPQGVVLRTITGAITFVRIPFEPLE